MSCLITTIQKPSLGWVSSFLVCLFIYKNQYDQSIGSKDRNYAMWLTENDTKIIKRGFKPDNQTVRQ